MLPGYLARLQVRCYICPMPGVWCPAVVREYDLHVCLLGVVKGALIEVVWQPHNTVFLFFLVVHHRGSGGVFRAYGADARTPSEVARAWPSSPCFF